MTPYTLSIRSHTVRIYDFLDHPDSAGKVAQLERFFLRLPDQHLAVLYPIATMELKPGGAEPGGTWTAAQVPRDFANARHEAKTGVPNADIHRVAAGGGLIGMPRNRWERAIGRVEFTLFHEVGHCVDLSLGGLVFAGASHADFPFMHADACRGGPDLTRKAVEAYARYICSPWRVYHTEPVAPPAADRRRVNRQLIATLRRSRAFARVPASWSPT